MNLTLRAKIQRGRKRGRGIRKWGGEGKEKRWEREEVGKRRGEGGAGQRRRKTE